MGPQSDRNRDLTASSPLATTPPPPPPPRPLPPQVQPPGGAVRMGACMGRCIAKKSSCLKRWRSTDENETELMTDEEEENNTTQRRKKKERKLIFRIIKFKQKDRKQFLDKFRERQDLNYSRLSSAPAAELTDIQLQSLDAQTLLATAGKDVTTTNCFAPAAASSRTSSSLDLEWEHEYGQHNHNRVLSRSWLFIDGAAAEALEDYEDDNKPLFNSPPSDEGCLQLQLQLQPKQQRFNGNGQSSSSATKAAAHGQQSQPQANFTRTSSRNSWSHISTPESLEWDIDEDQQNQMQLEDDNLDHETLELLHQIEMLKNKVLNETGDGLNGTEFGGRADGS